MHGVAYQTAHLARLSIARSTHSVRSPPVLWEGSRRARTSKKAPQRACHRLCVAFSAIGALPRADCADARRRLRQLRPPKHCERHSRRSETGNPAAVSVAQQPARSVPLAHALQHLALPLLCANRLLRTRAEHGLRVLVPVRRTAPNRAGHQACNCWASSGVQSCAHAPQRERRHQDDSRNDDDHVACGAVAALASTQRKNASRHCHANTTLLPTQGCWKAGDSRRNTRRQRCATKQNAQQRALPHLGGVVHRGFSRQKGERRVAACACADGRGCELRCGDASTCATHTRVWSGGEGVELCVVA
jgi:hypothetical protein